MPTIMDTITLTVLHCHSCGVAYAMPETLRLERKRDGGTWYCINGHGAVYKESDVQVERTKREAAEKDAAFWQTRAREEEAKVTAAAKDAARVKKRVGNGICPCCKRTFKQLARHMACKHPEMVGDAKRAASVAAERPSA